MEMDCARWEALKPEGWSRFPEQEQTQIEEAKYEGEGQTAQTELREPGHQSVNCMTSLDVDPFDDLISYEQDFGNEDQWEDFLEAPSQHHQEQELEKRGIEPFDDT